MKTKVTDKVLLVGLAGFLAWEAYCLINDTPHDTISERVWRAISKDPRKAILLGALAAHFGWQSADVYERYRNEE